MSAPEVIEQFKALPASERAQVAKFVVETTTSGFLNHSNKEWPMRKQADLSIWILRSMSSIQAVNEIPFPRDSHDLYR